MPQKSKANIVALDAENQPIAGLWAANEQIKLYDQHDAYWVARIKDDDFSKEQGAILLRSYGIKQGLGAHYLQKHFEKVWGWMSQIYLPPLNRGLIDLDARWQQATTRLQNDMSVATQYKNQHNLFSATSKLLWFCHPQEMIMYDSYVRTTLSAVQDKNIKPSNFLVQFSQMFDERRPQIQTAIQGIPRGYPYERRVLDKYLWLLGSKNPDTTLKRFKFAIKELPYA